MKNCYLILKHAGNPEQKISNVAIIIGSPPCESFIKELACENVDCVIGGEFSEWGVGEFARDAVLQGKEKSLIRLGHVMSEQYGMGYLVDWMKPKIPGIPIEFVEIPDLYSIM
jgi:putative NIF3 family GTP cyclohydrolase 1 type 2